MRQDTPSRHMFFTKGQATIVAWTAAVVVGYVLWAMSLPVVTSGGTCSGIGFGCTPSPRDGALIAGLLFGIPLLLAIVIVATLVLLTLTRRRSIASPLLAGTLATLWSVLAVPAAAALWFAGSAM